MQHTLLYKDLIINITSFTNITSNTTQFVEQLTDAYIEALHSDKLTTQTRTFKWGRFYKLVNRYIYNVKIHKDSDTIYNVIITDS